MPTINLYASNFGNNDPLFTDSDFESVLDALDTANGFVSTVLPDFESNPSQASWVLRYVLAAHDMRRVILTLQDKCAGELSTLASYYQRNARQDAFIPSHLPPLSSAENRALETVLSTANQTSGAKLAGFILVVGAHLAIGPGATTTMILGNSMLGGGAPQNPLQGAKFGLERTVSLLSGIVETGVDVLMNRTFLKDWWENGNTVQKMFAGFVLVSGLTAAQTAGMILAPFSIAAGTAIGTLGLAVNTFLHNPEVQKYAAFLTGQLAEPSKVVSPQTTAAYMTRQMYYADAVTSLNAYKLGQGNYCKEDIQRIGKYTNTLKQRDELRLLAEEKEYLQVVKELGIMENINALYRAAPAQPQNGRSR